MVSKTSDFGSYPDRPVIALWCNGNTLDSDSGIAGSNPVRAAAGHSYNGYYSGLLIRQIRVRIPGGPFKIWLRRLNRSGRWSRLPARSLLNACQRARSNLSRQKCRVQIPSELLITPHLTKQVQVATLSMWRYGFKSRWGDQMASSVISYYNRW